MNVKMFCWIKNVWDIRRIGFKLKIIALELTKSTKLPCLVLMTKYIFKTVGMMD